MRGAALDDAEKGTIMQRALRGWERRLLLMEFSGMSIADLADGVADCVFACVCWPLQCFAGVLRCVFGSGRAMIGGLAGE